MSPNSFVFAHELPQVLVPLFPHLGAGQAVKQLELSRKRGALQLVHAVAVPKQVRQLGLHVLQILLSEVSPYSLVFVQELEQALVLLFPQLGVGQASTQVDPLKYKGELQAVQDVAVPEQVKQLLSQVLQILLSDMSPNSFEFVQDTLQALVPLLPQFGEGH